ncbi:MAG TPA: redoxin domain-containing protein [Gaiellales bacterium]|nr:redoxin domain-containing protein [Gaiellales bacterium]
MRRALSASAIALLLALVALFAWQLAHRDDNAFRDDLRAGRQPEAPAFTLPRLDRPGTISSEGLSGHAAVLNFWASWCPPCADEAPDLNALSVRYGSLGVRFVGVDFNDAVDEARAFARRHDVPYSLVHDTRGVRKAFGVSAPPETYVIDGAGRAVVRIEGPVDTPLLEPYVRIAVARSGHAAPLDSDLRVGGETLSSLRGSPLLVAFVTPDCAACSELMRRLSALPGKPRVIALSEGGPVAGAVADPADTNGRGGGQAQRALGVTSFPSLLAIDAQGRLVAAPIGPPSPAVLSSALQRAGTS